MFVTQQGALHFIRSSNQLPWCTHDVLAGLLVESFRVTVQLVEHIYNCEVAAVLPHSDEMMTPASAGTFALRHPEHAITVSLKQLATRWLE